MPMLMSIGAAVSSMVCTTGMPDCSSSRRAWSVWSMPATIMASGWRPSRVAIAFSSSIGE
jgi:hypothetical protein